MTSEKRIERLTNWQIGLFALPILLHVLRFVMPAPADDDKRLTLTLFRFGVTIVCLILVGVLGWRKRQIRKEAVVAAESPTFDV